MSAIMHQIKDPTKLFTGSEALGKVFAMTSTNVPFSFLLTNGLGLVGSAGKGIGTRDHPRKWGLGRCLRYVRWPRPAG